jgi:hypothetical protein
MEDKLTSLEVIKRIIDLSREFKSGRVDSNLYNSVKASTTSLRKNNPDLDLEYFFNSLYTSTLISATRMLSESTFDDSIDSIMEIGKEYARVIDSKEDGENLIEGLQSKVIRFYLKREIIHGMLGNSVELSIKAIQDSFEEGEDTEE